ncbi:MAG: VOC family protein [Cyclobacteriaceae bacterium]
MKLGAFSISLKVKDIKKSKVFYETLGFKVFAGSLESKYLIMKNESSLIGLFQDMLDQNIITFNPGWDADANTLSDFDDVRTIQNQLKSKHVTLISEADESTNGPANLMVADPDGNVILIDQHVA